jgi:hypothetical protein
MAVLKDAGDSLNDQGSGVCASDRGHPDRTPSRQVPPAVPQAADLDLQPGLIAGPWREHWRGVKAVFPVWEQGGRSIYPVPLCTRWSLNNGAARRLTRYGPAV